MAEKRDEKEQFIETMRDRFASAEESEAEIRKEAEKDLEFVAGEQWDERVRKARETENRPVLTFNHLPTYVAQVSNEARQNKPQVRFGPVDSGADLDTAEVMEGMARSIQRRSRADVAYETALYYAAACSFGHFRLFTDYCQGEQYFDEQELRFGAILDPFSVYGAVIPAALGKKPNWTFVLESMPRDEYEQQYGDTELVGIGFAAGAKVAEGWIGEDVRIAEYWYVDSKPRVQRLAILPDGQRKKVFVDELPKEAGGTFELGSDGLPREREHRADTIYSCLTNGVEVLPGTKTKWVGRRIPVFTSLGGQMILRGRVKLFSLVRGMRDPQQLLNAYKSGIAENIGLANRVPYIGYTGQFKDPKWRNANVKNYPYLEADPITAAGQIAGLPQRQQFEAAVQALSVAAAQEKDDLKAIAGIYDASLGAQGNETSGIAIEQRQQQSGLTNFHFPDNLARAQSEAGEELGYAIPRVYDTKRQVRIIGEDEEERIVTVNAPYQGEDGQVHAHILDAGTYDVSVEIGPATSTKRREAAEQTGRIITAAPEMMGVMGDIYFRNADFAGAREVAERVKKWIQLSKPGLVDDKNAGPDAAELQAKLEQTGQALEQVTQQLNIVSEEMKGRKLEIDSKERIEMEKLEFQRQELQAKMLLEEAKLGSQEAIVRLEQELGLIRQQLDAARAAEEAEAAAAAAPPAEEPQQAAPDQPIAA